MKKLERFKTARSRLHDRYNEAFKGCPLLETPQKPARPSAPFWHLYTLRVKGEKTLPLRRRLFEHLKTRGILAQVHYLPIHLHPHFAAHLPAGVSFPAAEAFYAAELSLPLYPLLRDEEQDRVIRAVLEFA